MMRAFALAAVFAAGTASAQTVPPAPIVVAPAAPVATTGLVFGGLSTTAAVGLGVVVLAGVVAAAAAADNTENATNGTTNPHHQ